LRVVRLDALLDPAAGHPASGRAVETLKITLTNCPRCLARTAIAVPLFSCR